MENKNDVDYESVKVKKGKFSISDAIDIEQKVERRYRSRPKVTAKRNAK